MEKIFWNNLWYFCVFFGLLVIHSANAAQATNEHVCFDFSTPINMPLRDPPPQTSVVKDMSGFGTFPKSEKGIWGYARGKVGLPIQKIYDRLLDHYTIKDPKKSQLRVYPQEKQSYRDFHLVMVKAIVPLVDVSWEEEWAYRVSEGTPAAPKKVVISYQKTVGTSYIPHLCGSIVLKEISPNATDVYLYEEVNALGKRSAKETVLGHLGTLATLRK